MPGAPRPRIRLDYKFQPDVQQGGHPQPHFGKWAAQNQSSLITETFSSPLAGENGVGRIDIVENRLVGIKSRGVYETPGGTLLMTAHRDLESITLDRDTQHLKDRLSNEYAVLVYNGLWFTTKRKATLAALEREAGDLAASPFTIGHIAIGCALSYLDFRFGHEDWRAAHPHIADWHRQFAARPSVRATEPVDDS